MLREFKEARNNVSQLYGDDIISAYFAGRFDGDGSVDKNFKSDCRIVYGNKKEVEIDKTLIAKIGIDNTKLYYYKSANTFCLYISRYQARYFLERIYPYSVKLQKLAFIPRRDLAPTRALGAK